VGCTFYAKKGGVCRRHGAVKNDAASREDVPIELNREDSALRMAQR